MYSTGPNTALGHNTITIMIESQINYIISCIEYMRDNQVTSIDVKKDAEDEWNKTIQHKLQKSVWNGGCNAYYISANGTNTAIYPFFTFQYMFLCQQLILKHFNIQRK